ncbi:MAG: hypothetical protein K0S44_1280 [Bacteroidetes bacterium]|jgi:hypothetical protein|nr:hypothetical protein [Bacteroidota bacterium]
MKKKLFPFFLFLFISKFFTINAQEQVWERSDFWYNYIFSAENREKDNLKKEHVREKIILNADYSPSKLIYRFDTAGRMIGYITPKKEFRTAYSNEDKRLFTASYKKGKLIERDTFIWENTMLKECDNYGSNNQMFQRQRYMYDSTFVTEFVTEKVKKGKFREVKRVVYEYYPDYSYKKITFYKKGKPDYFTVFDCNPAGQNHKVEKDSTYNCLKYDVDSLGNKVKITITSDKNVSWKKVEYYNNKDECIALKTYDMRKNEELMWTYYFKEGTQLLSKFISYKHAKEYYRTETEFDTKNNPTTSVTYRRGKLKGRSRHTYNDHGLLVKTERFNKHEKKKKEISYLYQYY